MNTFDGGSADSSLPEGLYELLNTEALAGKLALVPELQAMMAEVEDDDAPDLLSRHVAEVVREALTAAKPGDRVSLANRLLAEIKDANHITDGPTQLLSLHRPDALKRRQLRRPTTKLSESALLTNSKDDPESRRRVAN